jgi:hypothetical protein
MPTKKTTAVMLKKSMNPKNRASFAELKNLDLKTLTDREKVLLRVINDLEEKLDKVRQASED